MSSQVAGDIARALDPVGQRESRTLASIGGTLRRPAGSTSRAASADVTGDPGLSLLRSVLALNPEAQSAIDVDDPLVQVLAFGEIANSGDPGTVDQAIARTTSAVIDVAVDVAALALDTGLTVAFLDVESQGKGFDQLTVRAEREGAQLFDVTFADLATATAWLDDNVLSFASLEGGADGLLDLRFTFDLSFSGRNDYFRTNFLVSTKVVPLPGAGLLLGTALSGVLVWRRRRPA